MRHRRRSNPRKKPRRGTDPPKPADPQARSRRATATGNAAGSAWTSDPWSFAPIPPGFPTLRRSPRWSGQVSRIPITRMPSSRPGNTGAFCKAHPPRSSCCARAMEPSRRAQSFFTGRGAHTRVCIPSPSIPPCRGGGRERASCTTPRSGSVRAAFPVSALKCARVMKN